VFGGLRPEAIRNGAIRCRPLLDTSAPTKARSHIPLSSHFVSNEWLSLSVTRRTRPSRPASSRCPPITDASTHRRDCSQASACCIFFSISLPLPVELLILLSFRRSPPGSNGDLSLPAALLLDPLGLPPAASLFFLIPSLGCSCTFSLPGSVWSSTSSRGSTSSSIRSPPLLRPSNLPRPGFFPRPSSSPSSALRLGSEFNHSSYPPSQSLFLRVVSLSGSAPSPNCLLRSPSPHRPTPATSPPPPSVTSPPPSPVTSPRTRRMGSVSSPPLRRPPLSRLPPFHSLLARVCPFRTMPYLLRGPLCGF